MKHEKYEERNRSAIGGKCAHMGSIKKIAKLECDSEENSTLIDSARVAVNTNEKTAKT